MTRGKEINNYLIICSISLPIIIISNLYPMQSLFFILSLIMFVITCYFIFKADHNTIYFLFVISIVQNFIVILLMGLFNIPQAYYLQYYKELFLLCLLVFLLLFRNKLNDLTFVDIIAIFFVLYVLSISLWRGEANNFTKMASLRQILIPFLFYFVGKNMFLDETNLKKLILKISNFGILIVLFGIVESFILPNFWQSIHIDKFLLARRGEQLSLVNGLFGNFYTFDFVKITGGPLRRMASFVANPPVLGHLLAFITVLVLFTRKYVKKGYLLILMFSIGVFLTIGKGGIITLLIGVLFYVLFILRKPLFTYFISSWVIIGIIAYIKSVLQNGLSASKHIVGFINSVRIAAQKPLGSGLGTSGNLAELYNNSAGVLEGGGGESFSGLIIGQLGIPGFILFSLFFIIIFVQMIRLMSRVDNKFYFSVTSALLSLMFSMYITGFLTESAISFTSAGIPILLSSIVINNYKYLIKEPFNQPNERKRKRIIITSK